MKGITNFEFVLSVFVFLSTISFVSVTIINKIPNIHQDSVGDEIKTNSFVVSELLLFDEGYPGNWNYTNFTRFGFSTGTDYMISKEKVDNFSWVCQNNRQAIIDSLGYLIINITKISGEPVLYCETVKPAVELKIRRYALLLSGSGQDIVKMDVVAG